MENLLIQMLEQAKKNHKSLIELKNYAAKTQQFELAANLRAIEKELFPETKEISEAKNRIRELKKAFDMCNLNIPLYACAAIDEVVKLFNVVGDEFSVKDASKIIARKHDLFLENEQ